MTFDINSLILRDPDPNAAGGGAGAGTVDDGKQGGGSNDGGAGTTDLPSWIDVLPEDAAKDPSITKYKTPEEFYNGYKSTVELVGRKGVIVPKENATPEEREKFFNDLGRPEKPEGYKLSKIENLHKSIEITPESERGYQMIAHKHGLTQQQADGINKEFLQIINKATMDQERKDTEAMQKAETALRQEWGEKYVSNVSMVAKEVLKSGGQEALDAMGGEKGIGNNPIILKTLSKIIGRLAEDTSNPDKGNGSGGAAGNETPEEAKSKISEMMNDPKHPINDEKHIDHRKSVDERMRLYKKAYPNEGGN